ncbi:hypothetical protein TNCV_3016041 [Trichonephila clavipes]|nr:hypothetical protein TNCV_3016041 [Trichonephila clavipes]
MAVESCSMAAANFLHLKNPTTCQDRTRNLWCGRPATNQPHHPSGKTREHGATTLRVKDDIKDVSSELVNGVNGCTSWMKCPELYYSIEILEKMENKSRIKKKKFVI